MSCFYFCVKVINGRIDYYGISPRMHVKELTQIAAQYILSFALRRASDGNRSYFEDKLVLSVLYKN